jgi:hypothetical protein
LQWHVFTPFFERSYFFKTSGLQSSSKLSALQELSFLKVKKNYFTHPISAKHCQAPKKDNLKKN